MTQPTPAEIVVHDKSVYMNRHDDRPNWRLLKRIAGSVRRPFREMVNLTQYDPR